MNAIGLTRAEVAREWGVTQRSAYASLRRAVAAGRVRSWAADVTLRKEGRPYRARRVVYDVRDLARVRLWTRLPGGPHPSRGVPLAQRASTETVEVLVQVLCRPEHSRIRALVERLPR